MPAVEVLEDRPVDPGTRWVRVKITDEEGRELELSNNVAMGLSPTVPGPHNFSAPLPLPPLEELLATIPGLAVLGRQVMRGIAEGRKGG